MTHRDTITRCACLLFFGLLVGCQTAPTVPAFGNFGGAARGPQPAPTMPPYDSAIVVRWFPIQAKFAPDGTWLVVNFCNYYNPHYCRLVRWEPGAETATEMESGRWRIIAGQEAGKSYLWPSISWDGKKLAFTVADCSAERPQDWPPANGKPGTPEAPPTNCEIFAARPAVSGSVDDIRIDYREIPIPTAARPTWRPDDKAIIYWRTKGQATLASGRIAGSRSIYEYDLGLGREEPKLDSVLGNMSWVHELAAPRYTPDGRRFRSCGFVLGTRTYVDHGFHCFEVSSTLPARLEVLNARGETAFDILHADWRGSHFLIAAGYKVYLVSQQDRRRGRPVIDAPKDIGVAIDADITEPNGDIVVLRGTVSRQMEPIRAGGKGYYSEYSQIGSPTPLLIHFRKLSGKHVPVHWPNLESINTHF